MDEQRAAGVIDLVARAEVDVSERLDDIEQATGMDVDARAPQDAAEDQQVIEETGHRRGCITPAMRSARCARSSSSAARAPRSASRSSFAFSTTPSVSSIAVGIERVPVERDERGHPVDGLGHAGHLVEVCALAAPAPSPSPARPARAGASGARSRTMASSFSNDGYSIH